jgi:putative spermidine/putrescine transport system substrate-binding protein
MCVSFSPGGPLLEYLPDVVKEPPTTIEGLLDWAKAHPKRFIYARPANSGPGRAFLMGVPYLLGDSNPKDPKNGWAKTWTFLRALGQNIEYYPSGTGALFQELGQGTRDMTVTMTGWDINPRALGVVPKSAAVGTMKGFHFVSDAHYMCVPSGVEPGKLAVLLDLMSYMLQPAQQAVTYDKGYFYPGPAVKDVPLSMAPKASQDVLAEYGRTAYYDKLIADTPIDTPLDAQSLVYAFQRWDQEIGANVGK